MATAALVEAMIRHALPKQKKQRCHDENEQDPCNFLPD